MNSVRLGLGVFYHLFIAALENVLSDLHAAYRVQQIMWVSLALFALLMANSTPVLCSLEVRYSICPPAAVESGTGSLDSLDGTSLSYRIWQTSSDEFLPERIILILPGIGMHGGFYGDVAEYLRQRDWAVYAMDYRGHGLSGGTKGELGVHTDVMADIDAMVCFIRHHHPQGELFLLGESMGALFALAYAAKRPARTSGQILAAPALAAHTRQLLCLEALYLPLFHVFAPGEPVIDLVGWRLELSSRDAKFKRSRAQDPLALKRISLQYLGTLWSFQDGWRERYPGSIRTPTFIIQGRHDEVVEPVYTEELYRLIKTEEKKLMILPDAWHTLFFDPDSAQVLEAISGWLEDFSRTKDTNEGDGTSGSTNK